MPFFLIAGTYVAPSITPGFHYKVRILGRRATSYLFQGRGLQLKSIGIGYGKRITFAPDTLNSNNNYFYSDTNEAGYAFELVAITSGQSFSVCSNELDRPIGQATVESVISTKECGTTVTPGGSVHKHVICHVNLSVQYGGDSHGLMSIIHSDLALTVPVMVVVCKPRGSREVKLKSTYTFNHPVYGACALHP